MLRIDWGTSSNEAYGGLQRPEVNYGRANSIVLNDATSVRVSMPASTRLVGATFVVLFIEETEGLYFVWFRN